ELYATVAPVAVRLDPRARAQLRMRLEVLVIRERTIALKQAEAARIVHLHPARADRRRVVERTPQPLAGVETQQQPVRVVHLRTKIVEMPARVLAEEEHARQRRDAELADRAPREKMRFDVDHGARPRPDVEPVRSG